MYLDRWLKDRHTFIDTAACKSAWDILSRTRALVLCGNPGDGKTTIAYYLLMKLANEGFSSAIVSSVNVVEQRYSIEEKVVFFFDDAFGNPAVNNVLVESWIRNSNRITALMESDNFRLILATRKQVFLSCKLELEGCECFQHSVLDMTDDKHKLTEPEKKAMLLKYCEKSQVTVTTGMLNQSCITVVSGFPLLCKLYTTNPNLQQIGDFFQKPLSVLVHQLQMLSKQEPKAFCGLIMVLVHDGCLSTSVFDVFEQTDRSRAQIAVIKEACKIDSSVPLTGIEEALRSLIGVYVVENEDSYTFLHDAVFDAATFVFGEKFPSQLLKMCTAKFLLRRVRCYTCKPKMQNDVVDMLYLPKRLTKDLACRFLSDLQKGYLIEVFENPSLSDKYVSEYLFNEIKKMSKSSTQHLLRRRANKTGEEFLNLVFTHGLVDLARYFLEEGVSLSDDIWLCVCKHGHIDIVDLLLENGVDINTVHYNMSALHVAAEEGHLNLLKYLLNKGANVSLKTEDGIDAICYASRAWHTDCVEFLINYGVDPNTHDKYNMYPIHMAAMKGDLDFVKFLIGKGADPFVTNTMNQQPFHLAAGNKNPETLSYLSSLGADPNACTDDGKIALHHACKAGEHESVELLLARGSNLFCRDSRQRLPLHEACMASVDCVDIIQLLDHYVERHKSAICHSKDTKFEKEKGCLSVQSEIGGEVAVQNVSWETLSENDKGPDLKHNELDTTSNGTEAVVEDVSNNFFDAKDDSGMTALHYSCKHVNDKGFARVRFLIEKGANIHVSDKTMMQPLLYACDSGSVATAKCLIKHGANIHWRDIRRQSAVHFAAAGNKPQMLELLIQNGADINSPCRDGMRPIHFASRQNATLTLSQLLKLGVNPDQEDDALYTPLFYACLHGMYLHNALQLLELLGLTVVLLKLVLLAGWPNFQGLNSPTILKNFLFVCVFRSPWSSEDTTGKWC